MSGTLPTRSFAKVAVPVLPPLASTGNLKPLTAKSLATQRAAAAAYRLIGIRFGTEECDGVLKVLAGADYVAIAESS
jgi:hypothetical protein